MSTHDRRATANVLAQLEQLIERMDGLGVAAEDAAGRVTAALGGNIAAAAQGDQHALVTAIGDVIEIVTERSRLAHEAHRLISDIRRRELQGMNDIRSDGAD
jgi:hypothetical protein